eukprot:Pgem_evm1s8543
MNIELLAIGAFLALVIIVGLVAGRKVTSFEDYAVGKKNFSNWVLFGSLIATVFGGGMLSRMLSYGYREVFYACIGVFSGFSYLVNVFFAKRMGEFLKHYSIAESMGSLYGKRVRLITAGAAMVNVIGTLVAE